MALGSVKYFLRLLRSGISGEILPSRHDRVQLPFPGAIDRDAFRFSSPAPLIKHFFHLFTAHIVPFLEAPNGRANFGERREGKAEIREFKK